MKARYPGRCSVCGGGFSAGADISYKKSAPRGKRTAHAGCVGGFSDARGSAAEAAAGVGNGGGEIYEFRTSGGTFYRNANGVCEDAPCCGCCTF